MSWHDEKYLLWKSLVVLLIWSCYLCPLRPPTHCKVSHEGQRVRVGATGIRSSIGKKHIFTRAHAAACVAKRSLDHFTKKVFFQSKNTALIMSMLHFSTRASLWSTFHEHNEYIFKSVNVRPTIIIMKLMIIRGCHSSLAIAVHSFLIEDLQKGFDIARHGWRS